MMTQAAMARAIGEGAQAMGIALDQEAAVRMAAFHAFLTDWNAHMDLTSVTEDEEAVARHYLDALTVQPLLAALPAGARVIDVGTGAGLPGVPLAICCPQHAFTLVDALRKRVDFLCAARAALGLPFEAVHMRAEQIGRDKRHREQYDVAVSRAVAALPALLELTLPLVRIGGCAVAMKGPGVHAELTQARRAAHVLGGTLHAPQAVVIPTRPDWQHQLVRCDKVRATPAAYPRKAGTPAKEPLGGA